MATQNKFSRSETKKKKKNIFTKEGSKSELNGYAF